jgi:hypothetical protein
VKRRAYPGAVAVAVAAAWLAVAGCAFREGNLDTFRCEAAGDACPAGRTCVEGLCVVAGTDAGPAGTDALAPPADAANTDGAASSADGGSDVPCDPDGLEDACLDAMTLRRCRPDGSGSDAVSCALGCVDATPPPHCAALVPAVTALAGAVLPAAAAGLVLTGPLAVEIDTDTGRIRDLTNGTDLRPSGAGDGGASGIGFVTIAQPGGPDLGTFTLTALDVGAGVDVTVVGDAALALIVAGDATVAGSLDLTGGRAGVEESAGPGGFAGGPDNTGGLGAGGGAAGLGAGGATDDGGGGGGHGGSGGDGGQSSMASGGAGGATAGTPDLAVLAGGSGGGAGRDGGAGGRGGGGGGALYLGAGGTLTVSGVLNAGGAGGEAGASGNAGGGGGAGGALLLEAPSVTLAAGAVAAANGGGGGGGGDGGTAGTAGAIGAGSATPAAGGGGGAAGGTGGAGAGAALNGAPGTDATDGAGGGGGAAGRVRVNALGAPSLAAGIVSPAASTGAITVQ